MKTLIDLLNQKEEDQLYTPNTTIEPVRGQAGTFDSLSQVDNADLGKAGQAMGLPINPTSTPLVPGLTNDELAQEQAAARAAELAAAAQAPELSGSANRSPAVISSIKNSGSAQTGTKELSPLEKLEAQLAELNNQRKKELEDAENRQWKANLIAGLAPHLGLMVSGAQAMNTKASVTPTQMPKIEVGDLVSGVDKKFKPELDQVLERYKSLKRANEPMTEYQRRQLELWEKGMDQKDKFAELTNNRFYDGLDHRKDVNSYKKIDGIQTAFNKDKQVVKSEEGIQSARTIREMVSSNNPIAEEAAKTFAARASGEVGALSDQDRNAYGGSKAILARIGAIKDQLTTGTLSDENRKFMLELSDKFEQANKRNLEERLSLYSKQATKKLDLDEKEVRQILRPALELDLEGKQTAPQTVERKTKDGRIAIFDATTKQFLKYKD